MPSLLPEFMVAHLGQPKLLFLWSAAFIFCLFNLVKNTMLTRVDSLDMALLVCLNQSVLTVRSEAWSHLGRSHTSSLQIHLPCVAPRLHSYFAALPFPFLRIFGLKLPPVFQHTLIEWTILLLSWRTQVAPVLQWQPCRKHRRLRLMMRCHQGKINKALHGSIH